MRSLILPSEKVTKTWVPAGRLEVGSIVRVAPDMLIRELVAGSKLSMIVPVADPDRSVIVPVPRAIFSEKVRVMLLPAGTFVAPSAGAKETTVGAVVSGESVLKS